MKNLYSCIIILTFFISCDTNSEMSINDVPTKEMVSRLATELPGNAGNPYDEAGWVHNELFESYYEIATKPSTVSGIIDKVETLADANPNFKAIKNSTYHKVSAERVQYLLSHKSTCVADVISASSLSAAAKLSLGSFITSLLDKFAIESSCDVLYNYVATYEKTIDSGNFTERDKQIMFITTSVARHTSYLAKKKPKKNTDPDWTVLVLHLAATVDGAEYGMAESATEALVTGIASN